MNEATDRPRPERRGFRKSVYIIPSLFTTANIFCGFSAVILSVNASVALNGDNVELAIVDFDLAAKFIGWAVLFDFLDGRVARMTNSTTQFGVEFDSIADVLTFGIAPAMLAYCWGGYAFSPEFGRLPWAISFLYLICGALRLARYNNVQASKPALQKPNASPKVDKKAFVGMPIPAGASLIAAVVHFAKVPDPESRLRRSRSAGAASRSGRMSGQSVLVLVACLSLLMVSTFRYTAFKSVGPRRGILGRHPLIAVGLIAVYYYSE